MRHQVEGSPVEGGFIPAAPSFQEREWLWSWSWKDGWECIRWKERKNRELMPCRRKPEVMGLQKGLKNGEPLQIPTYNRKAGEGDRLFFSPTSQLPWWSWGISCWACCHFGVRSTAKNSAVYLLLSSWTWVRDLGLRTPGSLPSADTGTVLVGELRKLGPRGEQDRGQKSHTAMRSQNVSWQSLQKHLEMKRK